MNMHADVRLDVRSANARKKRGKHGKTTTALICRSETDGCRRKFGNDSVQSRKIFRISHEWLVWYSACLSFRVAIQRCEKNYGDFLET